MSEPIRVLHILQRMEAGGTQALLMNLYRNIDRSKIQFDFLVEYKEKQFYDDEINALGGRIFRTSIREDYNIFKFCSYLKSFFKEHNEYKIVHVHAFTIGYFCLRAAEKAGVPIRIAHSHNNETVHDSKYLLKRLMQRLYTLHANELFACSQEAGKYLFGDRQFTVLKNAIDSDAFVANEEIRKEVRAELGLDDCLVIGSVGRLHPQKNQKRLIHIFNKVHEIKSDSKLLLIGSGPLEQELRDEVESLGLQTEIIFMGNRKNMSRLYQAMDVFAMTSLFEGLGIVAVESQAAGIPTVCSDGFPEDIRITPLVVKKNLSDSDDEWAHEILKAEENPCRHKNMKRKIIDSGFDVKSSALELSEYYIKKYKDCL